MDPSVHPGPLRPAVSPSAAGRDILSRCRTYLAGVLDSAPNAPSLTEACGPDIHPYLAARTATVTALARAATGQARLAGVRLTLPDETIPMQAYATGHGFDPAASSSAPNLRSTPAPSPRPASTWKNPST